MAEQWREMAKIYLEGSRFKDGALDLATLNELQHFQEIVTSTAKAIWKKENPDRRRLPQNFEDRVRLYVRTIEQGSVCIPLVKDVGSAGQGELFDSEPPRELTATLDVVHKVYEAVQSDKMLPEDTPKDLLHEYAKWGESLPQDISLGFAPKGKQPVRVTSRERERLVSFAEPAYQDEVDITGKVLEADVRQKKFQIWPDEHMKVTVAFTEEHESRITAALKEHETVSLRVKGRGEFTPQGVIMKISSVTGLDIVSDKEKESFDPDAPRIEDVIKEIAKDVPDEEWEKLPHDLTDRLDYYLYGAEGE